MHDGRGHVDCTDSPNGEVVRRTPQPREGKGGGGGVALNAFFPSPIIYLKSLLVLSCVKTKYGDSREHLLDTDHGGLLYHC